MIPKPVPAVSAAPPAEDPELTAELDRALAPYEQLLPPEMLAAYRDLLADALTSHPIGSLYQKRAREAKAPESSGKIVKD